MTTTMTITGRRDCHDTRRTRRFQWRMSPARWRTVGFTECQGANAEDGYEKIAIFADEDEFTHVARQLPTDRWTSKLGESWDIEHELEAVAGTQSPWRSFRYGEIVLIMRRPVDNG